MLKANKCFRTGTCREDQQDENRILYQDDLSHQLKKIENLATSGHVFTGEKIRSFPSHKVTLPPYAYVNMHSYIME